MKLSSHRYGKGRVRLLKVLRDGARHDLMEVEAAIFLEGDFAASFEQADNALVVPTDTMKNTLQVLARDHLGADLEPFGRVVAGHFLASYPQVSQVTLRLLRHRWERLVIEGQPHPHSFREAGPARPSVEVTATRAGVVVESGMEDLLVLKSTGSGFEGFPRDAFTTLPETRDRILATNLRAHWRWSAAPADWAAANQRVLDALLRVFATRYSPSVQATLFEMATAALNSVAEIDRVRLSMPNQHCLRVDLAPFGRENANEVFTPTDEPHGQIEATVER